jgi:predicted dehydrogenase
MVTPVRIASGSSVLRLGGAGAGDELYRVAHAREGLRMRVKKGNATEERDMGQRDHFALEMDHMSECVMNNKETATPGEEGLRDLRIMMAIYEAAQSGKTIKL